MLKKEHFLFMIKKIKIWIDTEDVEDFYLFENCYNFNEL